MNSARPTATRTPTVTLSTFLSPLRIVWYRLACSTSSAVSGASTGRSVVPGMSVASR